MIRKKKKVKRRIEKEAGRARRAVSLEPRVTTTENPLVPAANQEIIESSGADVLLSKIRPYWQAKRLTQRVRRLLAVDPSSACQRVFNACVHDLREKIVVAGLDVAGEAARLNRLPRTEKPEDVENLSVSHVIDLAYRMGLLTRPEWRRLLRTYDIRRDLEHEDDEYEAGVEDCVYIFKTCIEVVLSRDPIQVLRVTDVKDIVEQPTAASLTASVLEDYAGAPRPRQQEIMQFLISYALDAEHPEIVRHNSYNAMAALHAHTDPKVTVELAKLFMTRLGRKAPSLPEARVAFTAGILPYLRKKMLSGFFGAYLDLMQKTGHTFRSHARHGELLRNLRELGGLTHCPNELLPGYVEWLVLCYIGEPGGYGMGVNRRVFYSNVGAPIALTILGGCGTRIAKTVSDLRGSSPSIRAECQNEHVERRYQTIVDHMT